VSQGELLLQSAEQSAPSLLWKTFLHHELNSTSQINQPHITNAHGLGLIGQFSMLHKLGSPKVLRKPSELLEQVFSRFLFNESTHRGILSPHKFSLTGFFP